MTDAETTTGKGNPFFDRADQVAETGNWDYAIEMYLQGISRDPLAMDRGHHKLREMALMRKANGGKAAGFFEKGKHKQGKDLVENLVNAEWMMSRDPASVPSWKQIILAAKAGEWTDVVGWAGGVLFDTNRLADKPNKDVYLFLMDVYDEVKLYSAAVRACQMAIQIDKSNLALGDRMRDLSAKETIQKGKYDQEGDFTKAVVNLEGQIDLAKKDQISQDKNFLVKQIEQARDAYEAEPAAGPKINALADALTKIDDESYENEAIDLLAKAYSDTNTYRYRMRMGEIKARQINRRFNKLKKAGDKAGAKKVAKELLKFELVEYAERSKNYPTDLGIKYEWGRRLFVAGKYDEAIATLQQARRDPKRRTSAMSILGQAFFKKGWNTEAAETFEQALEADLTEARRIDLMYSLGTVLETQGKITEALEQYSEVAQIDFNFKDARGRIERLRAARDKGDSETDS